MIFFKSLILGDVTIEKAPNSVITGSEEEANLPVRRAENGKPR
jgi:hypothetical protein